MADCNCNKTEAAKCDACGRAKIPSIVDKIESIRPVVRKIKEQLAGKNMKPVHVAVLACDTMAQASAMKDTMKDAGLSLLSSILTGKANPMAQFRQSIMLVGFVAEGLPIGEAVQVADQCGFVNGFGAMLLMASENGYIRVVISTNDSAKQPGSAAGGPGGK